MVSDFLAELGRKDIHIWGDAERRGDGHAAKVTAAVAAAADDRSA